MLLIEGDLRRPRVADYLGLEGVDRFDERSGRPGQRR